MSLLASRLTSPVLTNVRIFADGVRLTHMHPVLPLDLFAGQDLIVLARYSGSGAARLRVEGRAPGGAVSWTTTARFAERERANPFVPRLWAAQRLGWLAAEKRKHGGNAELDAEIKSLGDRYGIPTEFSSYLVLEPGMELAGRLQDARERRNGAIPVPAAAPALGALGRSRDQNATSAESRFESAKQAAAQREAKTLAAVDSLSQAQVGTGLRQIGARQFAQQAFAREQNVWVDQRYTQAQRLVKVKAYSSLYFDLIAKLDGLAEVLVLGDQMVIAGRAVAIQIAPDGLDTMSDRETAELVKNW
jgi:hypothetical protein